MLVSQLIELRNKEVLLNNKVSKLTNDLAFATKPNLILTTSTDLDTKEVGLYVKNSGSGTAYINNMEYVYKGQKFNHLNSKKMDLLRSRLGLSILAGYDYFDESTDLKKCMTIANGKGIYIMYLVKQYVDSENTDFFKKATTGLIIRIFYSNSNRLVFPPLEYKVTY